jgi:acetylglutamate kinase
METLQQAEKANVLVEALPYIRKYAGQIVVIKYGGNAMINQDLKQAVMSDIVLMTQNGVRVVLVHGGGPEITQMLEKIGKKSEFVNGLRVTDKETVEVVEMVLAGKVNKTLVNLLQTAGGKAIGLSGMDGNLIQAKMKDAALGYVGEITKVNVQPVLDLLDLGYIPVISTVGCDDAGNFYNINADTVAAKIAGELKAECLMTLTDIAGILEDKEDPQTLISEIKTSQVPAYVSDGIISGGMIPKVESCVQAVEWGVKKVFIIDGRVMHSMLLELLTDRGMGTMVTGG